MLRNQPGSTRDAYDAFTPISMTPVHRSQRPRGMRWAACSFLSCRPAGLRWAAFSTSAVGPARPLRRCSRGWEVYGCDASGGMLAKANAKRIRTCRCVARTPPICRATSSEFDLVLSLNDVVNYLVGDGDLERCFAAAAESRSRGPLPLRHQHDRAAAKGLRRSGVEMDVSIRMEVGRDRRRGCPGWHLRSRAFGPGGPARSPPAAPLGAGAGARRAHRIRPHLPRGSGAAGGRGQDPAERDARRGS